MSRLAASGRILRNRGNIRRLSNAFISPPSSSPVKDHGIPSSPSEEGHTEPPLNGMHIAIKDNICTTEYPTTCGSRTLENFTSPYDATVVTRLRAAGAIIAGKTNLDEFGMGSHSTHSYFGPVTNTIKGVNDGVSAGGSSGGSALAVASGECDAALGTDTGGSVRLPAAYCGIVGFKPSYGLVSRWGVVAYANSLDTVGVLANSSYEAQKIFGAIQTHRVVASCLAHYSLDAIEGYDARDPTSVSQKSRYRIADEVRARQKPRRLRIGVPVEYNIQELNPTIREGWFRALSKLQKQGHTVHQVSLPATKHALSAYYVLAPAEASSNLAKYDGVRYGFREDANDGAGGALYAKTRGQGFGEEVKRRILLGAYSLSAEAIDNYFIQAQKVRRLVQQDFDRVFASPNPLLDTPATDKGGNEVDVLITPTAPTLPPTLEAVGNQTPLDAYMNDVFTVPASLAGLPAISLPIWMHFDKPVPELGYQYNEKEWSHPVGVQVIGQYGDDQLVFDVATLLELNTEGFVLEVGRNGG